MLLYSWLHAILPIIFWNFSPYLNILIIRYFWYIRYFLLWHSWCVHNEWIWGIWITMSMYLGKEKKFLSKLNRITAWRSISCCCHNLTTFALSPLKLIERGLFCSPILLFPLWFYFVWSYCDQLGQILHGMISLISIFFFLT